MTVGHIAPDGRHLLGHRIDSARLELVSILGYGAYGVVYRAVDVSRGYRSSRARQYAVKCLTTSGLDSRQRQFQRRELALHQLASEHPHVVAMRRIVEEGDSIYVIMDYCENGDLFGMITERQRYIGDDQLIKRVFLQIIDAVQYCHTLGIYHRDLKPENILCTNEGQDVYVADFGLATSERMSRDFGCGSTFYMSPECQGGIFDRLDSYSTQSNDVWSLGVILVNLTCGRNPWRQACPNDETFRAFLQNPNFLRSILPISKSLNYVLRRIFEVDPRTRLTLKQLRQLIEDIDTFNMSEVELLNAHSAAQAAAASVSRPRQIGPLVQLPPPPPVYENHPCSTSSSESYVSDYSYTTVEAVTYQHTPQLESSSPALDAICRSRSSSADSNSLPPTPEAIVIDVASIPPIPEVAFTLDEGSGHSGTDKMNNYIKHRESLRIMHPTMIETSPRHLNPFIL
jgi:serine/threonine protein kinase